MAEEKKDTEKEEKEEKAEEVVSVKEETAEEKVQKKHPEKNEEEKSETEEEKKEEKKEPTARTKKGSMSAKVTDAKISLKDSRIICKQLKNKKVSKSKNLLQGMIDKKRNLNGKYYTNAAKKILEILVNAEANAAEHHMEKERMFIYNIKADKGRTFYRPRTGLRRRGERAKMTHIEVTVGEK